MRIQYASDLHLEFSANSSYLKLNPLEVVGDILVLAGDIGYIGDDDFQKHPFWDWASESYKQVIIVPGNHEFYKLFDIEELYQGWQYEIRQNVKCYYNSVISLDFNTELIATTLWSSIDAKNALVTESSINDFRRIRSGNALLSWERFNVEHFKCLQFLTESIQYSKADHIIVVTHHVPSFELMSKEFNGSAINGAFTVELRDFIEVSNVEYWIYGHSHRNINKIIGKTACISNQFGYVFQGEHASFSHNSFIEIS